MNNRVMADLKGTHELLSSLDLPDDREYQVNMGQQIQEAKQQALTDI